MRVLVAPDKFAGTLTAVEAAEAIAAGLAPARAPTTSSTWRRWPTAGPGFVDVLHAALGGELLAVTVRGPHGEPVPGDGAAASASTAYVESAQACGLHLTGGERRRGAPRRTASASWSPRRVDAGRHRRSWSASAAAAPTTAAPGCSAALGRHRRPAARRAARAGLAGVTEVDLGRAASAVGGVELVAASDVDNPLTGLFGATKTFGPQKGIAEERLPGRRRLARGSSPPPPTGVPPWRRAPAPPAGSASRCCCSAPPASPGIDVVADAVGLRRAGPARPTWWSPARAPSTSPAAPARCRTASRRSPREALRPCVALAGQVLVGSREMRALGIESAYSAGRPGGGGARLRRPGRQPGRRSPSGSPAPGRAERPAPRSDRGE